MLFIVSFLFNVGADYMHMKYVCIYGHWGDFGSTCSCTEYQCDFFSRATWSSGSLFYTNIELTVVLLFPFFLTHACTLFCQ